jgi:hypothetical protein
MPLYSTITHALSSEGVRFILETLAREFVCNATLDEINESIEDKTSMPVDLILDDFGLHMRVVLSDHNHVEQIETGDLGINTESAELLGRRVYAMLTRFNDLYLHDAAVLYDACDDDYYEDSYDEYDDLDAFGDLDGGSW